MGNEHGTAAASGPVLPAQRCAVPLLVRGGTVQSSGVPFSAREVAERVGWLVEPSRGAGQRLVDQRWNHADLARLSAGVDEQGRRLPA